MFDEMSINLGLGKVLSQKVVIGGLTNKIYKVKTDNATYAIKELNENNIRKDKNFLDKIEFSEQIANIARSNGINSVNAIKFNGRYIQNYYNKNFLVYNWCNGKILLTKEINLERVRILANQLAKLHSIKVEFKHSVKKYNKINYLRYYNIVKNIDEECYDLFKQNICKLCKIYDNVYDNYLKLSFNYSYVHRDLNRKNVLWVEDIPNIIDWETATISNPCIDFFNSAWFLTADVDEKKYYEFSKEYFSNFSFIDDIKVAAYSAIIEECNWLEFSLKRALRINTNDIREISLGKESIFPSLREIINYYDKIPLMIDIIKKVKNEK